MNPFGPPSSFILFNQVAAALEFASDQLQAGRPVVLMPSMAGGVHAVRLDAPVDPVPLPETLPAELESLPERRSRILCRLRRGR